MKTGIFYFLFFLKSYFKEWLQVTTPNTLYFIFYFLFLNLILKNDYKLQPQTLCVWRDTTSIKMPGIKLWNMKWILNDLMFARLPP